MKTSEFDEDKYWLLTHKLIEAVLRLPKQTYNDRVWAMMVYLEGSVIIRKITNTPETFQSKPIYMGLY